MFSYCLALITYYTLCIHFDPPQYVLRFRLIDRKIQVIPLMVHGDEPVPDHLKLLLTSYMILLSVRYDLLNRTHFLDDVKTIKNSQDARHMLYKYSEILPEKEFIAILAEIPELGDWNPRLHRVLISSLLSGLQSGQLWSDISISHKVVISSGRYLYSANRSAILHPLSRLLYTDHEGYHACKHDHLWRVLWYLDLAEVYGIQLGNEELAIHYYEDARQIFKRIERPDEKLPYGYAWQYVENHLSNVIARLLQIGATREALAYVQKQKSLQLISVIREKYKQVIPPSYFEREASLLQDLQEISYWTRRHPFYMADGESWRMPYHDGKHYTSDELEDLKKGIENDLAQLYSEIAVVSPEYAAVRNEKTAYPEILRLLDDDHPGSNPQGGSQ
jgi:hypothetical protein